MNQDQMLGECKRMVDQIEAAGGPPRCLEGRYLQALSALEPYQQEGLGAIPFLLIGAKLLPWAAGLATAYFGLKGVSSAMGLSDAARDIVETVRNVAVLGLWFIGGLYASKLVR